MIQIAMEMPKTCYDCPLAMQSYATLFGNGTKQIRNSYACVLTHKAITSTKRNRFCPLRELVRCKDCKYGKEACGNIECFVDSNAPSEYHGYEWFCPNGDKKVTE